MSKRILIGMIIITGFAIGAYALYPLPLEDVVSFYDELYVVHIISSLDDAEPLMDTTEYFQKKESEEIRPIK